MKKDPHSKYSDTERYIYLEFCLGLFILSIYIYSLMISCVFPARDHMKAILKNPSDFSVDEKIETLIKFHKDTCANVFLKLYPSTSGDEDARQDLQILKDFAPILVDINLEYQKNLLEANYHRFSATLRLLQMKASMSNFLKSPGASLYPEDFRITLEKLGDLGNDDDENYYTYEDDEEHIGAFQSGKNTALAKLQKLGVDMSQYQDDSDGYEQYFNGQPTQEEILDQYKLLEKEVTRTVDKVALLMENVQPTHNYLGHIKHHVVFMERALTGTLFFRSISCEFTN
ncbi:hypothetical protein MKW94_010797 [Papaver nudicaule]|uniref:Uncharacterized protein n=1 Tax=Papaver nudicaule TaxID=74823 RepID=A0AA41S4U0_PAPNU|nr:hypothetical protein [Papaver nudicaule]